MKILVIGSNGQLGTDLCKTIAKSDLINLDHKDIEITDFNSVKNTFNKYTPDVVINTAAYVKVDDCETEIAQCFQVNALGAKNVAIAAQEINAKLVFISTDYIFGKEDRSNPYTEFDHPGPLNKLGISKVQGEEFVKQFCYKHFIIRVSGLFGTAGSSGKGGNFIETILKLASERDQLSVVNDQVFSPTYSYDAAKKINQLVQTENYGTFHITNRGTCSWYEFTRKILDLVGSSTPLIPISSDEYPQKAKRPNYSVLDNFHLRLLNMDDMRDWQVALKDYLIAKGHIR